MCSFASLCRWKNIPSNGDDEPSRLVRARTASTDSRGPGVSDGLLNDTMETEQPQNAVQPVPSYTGPETTIGHHAMLAYNVAHAQPLRDGITGHEHEIRRLLDPVKNQMRKINERLHVNMSPSLYEKSGYNELVELFDEGLRILGTQDKIPPKRAKKSRHLEKLWPLPRPDIVVVSSEDDIRRMVGVIAGLFRTDAEALLAIDLEAVELSRDGDIAILTVYVPVAGKVYLVDVSTLKAHALDVAEVIGGQQYCLRQILEAPDICKLMWDCRSDNDALFGLYEVVMDGVVDVQLMELATRQKGKSVLSLGTALSIRGGLPDNDSTTWQHSQNWGKLAMRYGPQEIERRIESTGGNWEDSQSSPPCDNLRQDRDVLEHLHTDLSSMSDAQKKEVCAFQYADQRPVHHLIQEYCVSDVVMLPALCNYFRNHDRCTDEIVEKCEEETRKRLEETRSKKWDRSILKGAAPPTAWQKKHKLAGDQTSKPSATRAKEGHMKAGSMREEAATTAARVKNLTAVTGMEQSTKAS